MADNNSAANEAAIFEDGGNLIVDMTGVAEAKFENIPKGIYAAEIDSVEYKMSSKNSPMWEVWMRITDGEFVGRKLPTYITFSPKAIPFAKASINKFAPELASSKFDPKKVADEGSLLGRPLRIRVGIREYEGEDRSNITALLAAGAGGANGQTAGASGNAFL